MSDLDVTGSNVLEEIFENAVEETPEIEAPAEEIPAEETPSLEETPGEETPPVEPEEEVVPDKVPEGYVPIPVHAELRAKARDTEKDLRQQLTASQIAQAKAEAKAEILEQIAAKAPLTPPPTPEKSPLEQFDEDFPGEAVTATVLLEQQRFVNAQTEQQAVQTRTQNNAQLVQEGIDAARNTYSEEKMGSELDLDSIVRLAKQHGVLTEDDVLSLASRGKLAGVVLYNTATAVIKQAGGAPLQELNRRVINARQALATKNETNKPKPPVKPVVPAAPAGAQPKIDEDDADVDGITNWMFS